MSPNTSPSEPDCFAAPAPRARRPITLVSCAVAALLVAACSHKDTTAPSISLKKNPCGNGTTVSLAVAQATTLDCSNGGTTVTLEGNGASYLIVPEFPTDAVPDTFINYRMYTGSVAAAVASANRVSAMRSAMFSAGASSGALPPMRNNRAQMKADRLLQDKERSRARSSNFHSLALRMSKSVSKATVPAVGSIKSFHVLSSFTGAGAWKNVGAQLVYAGTNVLVYNDTLSPANGFTSTQLQTFGQFVDQTLYDIDTTAFGGPSDVDGNGHVIMLMSPTVNADTPSAQCQTEGYVAGFFDSEDFDGPADPNSNQGEIFYSIVPDPTGAVSCPHAVDAVEADLPATFLHELQHLIDFSQHVIVSGGNPGSSWMDEGMSIVAEELGSLYYENKCPPPACRTNPSQIFPDSSQGFVSDFLYDSYQYALLPDTASITLHDDSENGFSWRGGAWLLMRYLGDQNASGFYRQLERGPADGLTDIEQAAGQTFSAQFANFGLALYTDSLPGLPRSTAPSTLRFSTRNVKQLWARLYATSASSDIPLAAPLQVFPITTDTTTDVLDAGTTTYFRIDSPSTSPTVTIQFSTPLGGPFPAVLRPQLAIFRLPAGQ